MEGTEDHGIKEGSQTQKGGLPSASILGGSQGFGLVGTQHCTAVPGGSDVTPGAGGMRDWDNI